LLKKNYGVDNLSAPFSENENFQNGALWKSLQQ